MSMEVPTPCRSKSNQHLFSAARIAPEQEATSMLAPIQTFPEISILSSTQCRLEMLLYDTPSYGYSDRLEELDHVEVEAQDLLSDLGPLCPKYQG